MALGCWLDALGCVDGIALCQSELGLPKLGLFADAKSAENLIKQRFGDFVTGDFAEGMDGYPQVNCPKVEGELLGDRLLHLL